jgi:hypothetical protein
MLSKMETRRRREAVDFARASVELEGFKVSPERLALSERFVSGEIDIEEYFALREVNNGQ